MEEVTVDELLAIIQYGLIVQGDAIVQRLDVTANAKPENAPAIKTTKSRVVHAVFRCIKQPCPRSFSPAHPFMVLM
jgi:hypothetical protein